MRELVAASAVILGILAAAGCGRGSVVELPAPIFESRSADYVLADGDSVVWGSAFSRQRGGDLVSCAGNTVYLMPDTEFYNWVLSPVTVTTRGGQFGIGGARYTDREYPVAERLNGEPSRWVRTTSCDIDGRFEFQGIPRGSYIVATVITWFAAGSPQGGAVSQSVVVDGVADTEVTLTNVS